MMEGKSPREGSRIYREQLITTEDLEIFKTDLLNEIKRLLKENSTPSVKKWVKSSEARKMLGISPGTLQNLRINGSLPFTKIGGIIFYKYDDIVKLLEGNSSQE